MNTKITKFVLFFMCLLIAGSAFSAQQQDKGKTIQGVVSDDSGETLIGVSITVKNFPTIGASTDGDGKFTLNLPAGAKEITIKYLGLVTQTVIVPNEGGFLNIVMKSDDQILDEVVVTGYGNMKKSVYSGAASVIDAKKLGDVPAVSMNSLLQGNASGVMVTAGTNQPGSPSEIRIRGLGSINASQNPLYVIDGIPVISGDIGVVNSSSAPGLDIMSSMNTSDIENITVIKDAAAAALYGSRAANGVILVTTKSGKKGKTQFNVKTDMGFTEFAMPYRTIMTGQERRDMQIEGYRNEQLLKGVTDEAVIQAYINSKIDDSYDAKGVRTLGTARIPWSGFVDWDKELFRKGSYRNYEASASGGNDATRTYASLSYTDQEGTTSNSGLKRISGKFNVDWNATSKFTLGIKTLLSNVNQDVFSEGTSYTSPFYSSRNAVVPSDAIYNEDGTWNREFIRNGKRNPKLAQTYNEKKEKLIRANNIVYGQYEILPELKYKTTFSYDFNYSKGSTWDDPRTSDGESSNGTRTIASYEYNKWMLSNSASYLKTFAKKHTIDAIVAFEVEEYKRDYVYGSQSNFINPNLPAIANGAVVNDVSGSPSAWRMVSLVSRLNYDYLSKYNLGVSYRYDGSSRLARKDNNRWSGFYSVSGSWRITEEAFMEDYKDKFSDLRLRASYGTSGNLPSSYYGYYGLSSLGSKYLDGGGITSSQVANTDLTWEKNKALNIGLDIQFLKRFNVSVEYYNRKTADMLMAFPISYATGFSSYQRNIGSLQNRGFEAEFSSLNFATKDFTWTTKLNLGKNQNKILKWDGDITSLVEGNFIRTVGKDYYTYYMVEFGGIDPADGEPMFVKNTHDENGKIIDKGLTKVFKEAEKVEHKGYEPKLSGGLTNSLAYKAFDLNFQLNFSTGGYSYDNGAQKAEHGGQDMLANIPAYYSAAWKKPGDITDIERFVANRATYMSNQTTTRRLHPIDYLRLSNLTFGVSAPKSWLKKTGLSNVRLYASGVNLLTWATYTAYDPASIHFDGYVEWEQPPLRTWTFGLDIKF
ncbi:SusC/RagA family TonB-linked outer membrane protein [Bacteroidia bacterium]|nr:SusC/RagA family TonB-linked outer membrane protein [Bacteroidia bacterium]